MMTPDPTTFDARVRAAVTAYIVDQGSPGAAALTARLDCPDDDVKAALQLC